MFKNAPVFTSFSIKDLVKAEEFYGTTLGLNVEKMSIGLSIKLNGGGDVFLYPKQDHEPATFTVLNFKVDNIDAAVDELTSKGVAFEHYTGDIATDEKGIMRSPDPSRGPTIAWFKDPCGNILSVLQEK